jgi:glycosyltransferase involved in cell wall biosynthesis
MSLDVTVAVCSFGGREWQVLAESRAVPSAIAQAPVIRVHGESLHDARNTALDRVETEYVIFLDADDELEPGYVEQMAAGTADLRAPAVRYVKPNGRAREPYVPVVAGHRHFDYHGRVICSADCLRDGNWLVVGSLARTGLLREVGGWEPWPLYEDWALWLRCWHAGATVEAVPQAVYRAHVRPDSRNRAPAMSFKNRVHHEIVAAVLGEQQVAA